MARNFTPTEGHTLIEPGDYVARVGDMEIREGKADDQLMVPLTIVDGKFEGSMVTDWVSYSPAAAFRLSNFLISCGHPPGEDIDIDDIGLLNEEFGNNVVSISVTIEEWNGKKNNKVARYETAPQKPTKKSRKKNSEATDNDDDINW